MGYVIKYYGDKIKGHEMTGTCSSHGGKEKCKQNTERRPRGET